MFFHRRTTSPEEKQDIEYLFVYGTLGFPEILSAAIGRKVTLKDYKPATLHGFKRYAVKDARFPVIRKSESSWVEGYYLHPITKSELIRLDDWEGGLYVRTAVMISIENGESLRAWVYADLHHKAPILQHDWTPETFLNTFPAA